MKTTHRWNPPEICPNCGAEVPPTARACPHCGADEETGWSDRAAAQRLDLPDDEFDYEEFVRTEFGPQSTMRPRGVSWLWFAAAVLVAVGLLLLLLGLKPW